MSILRCITLKRAVTDFVLPAVELSSVVSMSVAMERQARLTR